MFKKIRAALLAGIVASALAVSAYAQESATEDFSIWHKKGPSNGLLIAIGVLSLVTLVGAVYLIRRRNEISK